MVRAEGIRATGIQHAVEGGDKDGGFGLLGGEAAGSDPAHDQGLVPTHGVSTRARWPLVKRVTSKLVTVRLVTAPVEVNVRCGAPKLAPEYLHWT